VVLSEWLPLTIIPRIVRMAPPNPPTPELLRDLTQARSQAFEATFVELFLSFDFFYSYHILCSVIQWGTESSTSSSCTLENETFMQHYIQQRSCSSYRFRMSRPKLLHKHTMLHCIFFFILGSDLVKLLVVLIHCFTIHDVKHVVACFTAIVKRWSRTAMWLHFQHHPGGSKPDVV